MSYLFTRHRIIDQTDMHQFCEALQRIQIRQFLQAVPGQHQRPQTW